LILQFKQVAIDMLHLALLHLVLLALLYPVAYAFFEFFLFPFI